MREREEIKHGVLPCYVFFRLFRREIISPSRMCNKWSSTKILLRMFSFIVVRVGLNGATMSMIDLVDWFSAMYEEGLSFFVFCISLSLF